MGRQIIDLEDMIYSLRKVIYSPQISMTKRYKPSANVAAIPWCKRLPCPTKSGVVKRMDS